MLSCKHDCSEESGCIAQELSCKHEHDNECGYQAAVEGTPCGYVCDECNAEEEAATEQTEIATQAETSENGIAVMSNAIVKSGTLENIKWELNDVGTLTIIGSGAMPILSSPEDYPWSAYLDSSNSITVKTVLIGNGITTVSKAAFRNSDTIEEVQLADSVTWIGNDAFSGNINKLKAIRLSDNLTDIGDRAFQNCMKLSLDKLPASLKTIGASAFYDNECLTLVELPSGLSTIGTGAFQSCGALKTIKIPAGVNGINSKAFADCIYLTTVIFEGKRAPSMLADDAFDGTWIGQIRIPEDATGYEKLINALKANNNQLDVVYTEGSSSGGSASATKPVSAEDSKRAAQAARDASALALYTPAQYVMLQDGRFVEAAVRVGGTSDEMRTAFAAVSPAFGLTVADTFAASVEGINSADTVTIFLAPGSIPKDGILLAVDALGNLTLAKTETFADGTMAVTIPASCQIAVCTMAAASAA